LTWCVWKLSDEKALRGWGRSEKINAEWGGQLFSRRGNTSVSQNWGQGSSPTAQKMPGPASVLQKDLSCPPP